ncbi:hypothetical protein [Deminuibacter soli]|uniref:Uncharacterized protein n=1 Tax=Deminuibacter soli TaxID=2291815 RepID=A0A3E1NDA3_9BACT|nr:hypothetical protein [Deminuibacter soli]RFM25946.1 hypothetical protein DXN05_22785 [Deminuibacter soli]
MSNQINNFHSLRKEHYENPSLVIEEFTQAVNLEFVQKNLWDWFKTFDGSAYAEGMHHTERSMHIELYEQLLLLAEYAFLMHERKNPEQFP